MNPFSCNCNLTIFIITNKQLIPALIRRSSGANSYCGIQEERKEGDLAALTSAMALRSGGKRGESMNLAFFVGKFLLLLIPLIFQSLISTFA